MARDFSDAAFRMVMSRLAGAVNIVATGSAANPAGWRGMTVTAVCSLCAEPPSLVVCLNRVSGTRRRLEQLGVFSVNVLSSSHIGLARTFAGYDGLTGADRFTTAEWGAGTLAVPVLTDALACFECRLCRSVEHGTHTLLIGEIETGRWCDDDAGPLVYHRHRFRDLGHELTVSGGATA